MADRVAGYFVVGVVGVAVLTLRRLGLVRAGAALGLRPDQRRRGADHRLPVRARPGHADVDHGRDRHAAPRRACCSATRRRSRTCARSTRLIVDKTGTLTRGQARARSRRRGRAGFDEDEVLRLAASLEQGSEHPLARGDRRARARERGLALDRPEDFESITGIGVRGTVDGTSRGARQHGADEASSASHVDALAAQAEALRAAGASVMYPGRRRPAGRARWRSPIRSRRRRAEALAALQRAGLRIVMAHRRRLDAPREAVGARSSASTRCIGEVRPRDKLALVERLQREGRIVAMAGDGINDAPGARAGRRRHRDGHRHRRRDGERAASRSSRATCAASRARAALARDDAQHEAEPVLCLRLQRARRADRGRRAVSVLRHAAVADDRRAWR